MITNSINIDAKTMISAGAPGVYGSRTYVFTDMVYETTCNK